MAKFPRQLLADHEDIVFELKPHWLALVGPAFWTVVAFAILFIGSRVADDKSWETTGNQIATAIAVVLWIALALVPFLRWKFTIFLLTTDRLITRTGVIAKSSKEIPLERINDVAFSQSVLDRFLGAGDLMVESAGERGQTRISNVRKPEQVQLMIYKESEANNDRMMRPSGTATATAPGAAATIPEQIEALARLRKQGVLEEAEFQAKKKELLDRL